MRPLQPGRVCALQHRLQQAGRLLAPGQQAVPVPGLLREAARHQVQVHPAAAGGLQSNYLFNSFSTILHSAKYIMHFVTWPSCLNRFTDKSTQHK